MNFCDDKKVYDYLDMVEIKRNILKWIIGILRYSKSYGVLEEKNYGY